jgi:low affinity Fe/Cu permease
LSIFDRFAETASEYASHAGFFIGCALVVLLWLPSYFIIRDLNTWQLIINTMTTIITFLLVALLQNSQRRSEHAIQLKLDALVDGLADLVSTAQGSRDGGNGLSADIKQLRAAAGAEQKGD